MTDRKPPGMPFETWVDRQIREAQERGAFDNLPGAGKPIPGAGRPDDEMWWVNQLLQREQIAVLPPTLKLRKDVEDGLASLDTMDDEDAVRRVVTGLNERIRDAIRRPTSGPPLRLAELDVEEVVARWRDRRA